MNKIYKFVGDFNSHYLIELPPIINNSKKITARKFSSLTKIKKIRKDLEYFYNKEKDLLFYYFPDLNKHRFYGC